MSIFSTKSYYCQQSNDSSKAYAVAGNDASYKYYNNMTWSMWIACGPGNSHHFWSNWEQVSGNNRAWLISNQTDGSVRILNSWNGTNFSNLKTPANVLDYTWKHVVFTFASGTITCYINGVAQTLTVTTAWTGGAVGMNAANVQCIIGDHSPSNPPADTSVNGAYSNYSLWNKVLSGAEINEIYNNGTPTDLSTHSAVANLTNWIRMDQTDNSTTLTDSIASGASCTITVSGTSGIFKQGDNFAVNWSQYFASGVWSAALTDYTTSTTFGGFVQKLLTVAKFIGLK